jgi:transcriptional regulator with XRE-family HTH domain
MDVMKLFDLGQRIKELRQIQNISQTELAEIIGKRQESVNRIEKGKFFPSYDVLLSICKALDVSLGEFFSDDELSPDLQHWLQAGKKLSPEQRKSLLSTIDTLIEK